MIVLLDTDVLIDLALDRSPYVDAATELIDALEVRPASAFVAWHSLSNFHYLVAPSRGKRSAQQFLEELTRFVQVSPTTTESFRFAVSLTMRDFEDAMQVAAAQACGAEVIATRKLRDYANAPIEAAKPETVLEQLLV